MRLFLSTRVTVPGKIEAFPAAGSGKKKSAASEPAVNCFGTASYIKIFKEMNARKRPRT
jgi:hypothetical protein